MSKDVKLSEMQGLRISYPRTLTNAWYIDYSGQLYTIYGKMYCE